ncbi:MAG: DUF2939 domain-containing protein [Sphingomicrobium sp.]
MSRRWLMAAVAAAILASVGWYFGSPAWTLKQMADAARARDAEKLSGYIDFPTLRDSTKAQLKAGMTAKLASGGSHGFEALGMMIGMTMVDGMIDGMLTPEGIGAMFAAQKRPAAGSPSAAKKPFGVDAHNREIVHDGLNRFRLHEKGKSGSGGDLIFERHGLSWKLARIEVPKDVFDEKK